MAPNSKGKATKSGTKSASKAKSNTPKGKSSSKVESSSESYAYSYYDSDSQISDINYSDYYDSYSDSEPSYKKNKGKKSFDNSNSSYYTDISDTSGTYTSKSTVNKSKSSKKSLYKNSSEDKIEEIYKKFKIKRTVGSGETLNEDVSYLVDRDRRGNKKLVKNVMIYINIPKPAPKGSKSQIEIAHQKSNGILSSPMNGYKPGSHLEVRKYVILRYIGGKYTDESSSMFASKSRSKSTDIYSKTNDNKVPMKKSTKSKDQKAKNSSKHRSKSVEPKSKKYDESSDLFSDAFGTSDAYFDTDTATMIDENEIDYSKVIKPSGSGKKTSKKARRSTKSGYGSSSDNLISSSYLNTETSESDIPSSSITIPKSPHVYRSGQMQFESPHPSKYSEREVLNRFMQGATVNNQGQIMIKVNKVDESGKKIIIDEILPKTMIIGHDYIASNSYIYHDSDGRPYLRVIKQQLGQGQIENFESRLYISDPEAQQPFDVKIPGSKKTKKGIIVPVIKTKLSKRTGEVREFQTDIEIENPILRSRDFVFISPQIEYDVRTKRRFVRVIRQRKNPVTRKVENVECREDVPNIPTMIENNLNITNEHVWIVSGHIYRIIVKYIPYNNVIINAECLQEVSASKRSQVKTNEVGGKTIKVVRTRLNPRTGLVEQFIDEEDINEEAVGNKEFIAPDPTIYRHPNGKAYFKAYKHKFDEYSHTVVNFECEEDIPERELIDCPILDPTKMPKNNFGIPIIRVCRQSYDGYGNKEIIEETKEITYKAICGLDFICPSQCVYRNRDGQTYTNVIRTRRNPQARKFENYERSEIIPDNGKGMRGRKCIRERKNVLGKIEEFLIEDDLQRSNTPKIFTDCFRKRWNPYTAKFELYECHFEVPQSYAESNGKYNVIVLNRRNYGNNAMESIKELTASNGNDFKKLNLKYIRKSIVVVGVRKTSKGKLEAVNVSEEVYVPQFTTDIMDGNWIQSEIAVTRIGVDSSGNMSEYTDFIRVYDPINSQPMMQNSPRNIFSTPKDFNRYNLSPEDYTKYSMNYFDDFYNSDIPMRPSSPVRRSRSKDVADTDVPYPKKSSSKKKLRVSKTIDSSDDMRRKPSTEKKHHHHESTKSVEKKSKKYDESSEDEHHHHHHHHSKDERKKSVEQKPSSEKKREKSVETKKSRRQSVDRKPSTEKKSSIEKKVERKPSVEKKSDRKLSVERKPSAEKNPVMKTVKEVKKSKVEKKEVSSAKKAVASKKKLVKKSTSAKKVASTPASVIEKPIKKPAKKGKKVKSTSSSPSILLQNNSPIVEDSLLKESSNFEEKTQDEIPKADFDPLAGLMSNDTPEASFEVHNNFDDLGDPLAALNALDKDINETAENEIRKSEGLPPLDQGGLPPLDGGFPPIEGHDSGLPPIEGGFPPFGNELPQMTDPLGGLPASPDPLAGMSTDPLGGLPPSSDPLGGMGGMPPDPLAGMGGMPPDPMNGLGGLPPSPDPMSGMPPDPMSGMPQSDPVSSMSGIPSSQLSAMQPDPLAGLGGLPQSTDPLAGIGTLPQSPDPLAGISQDPLNGLGALPASPDPLAGVSQDPLNGLGGLPADPDPLAGLGGGMQQDPLGGLPPANDPLGGIGALPSGNDPLNGLGAMPGDPLGGLPDINSISGLGGNDPLAGMGGIPAPSDPLGGLMMPPSGIDSSFAPPPLESSPLGAPPGIDMMGSMQLDNSPLMVPDSLAGFNQAGLGDPLKYEGSGERSPITATADAQLMGTNASNSDHKPSSSSGVPQISPSDIKSPPSIPPATDIKPQQSAIPPLDLPDAKQTPGPGIPPLTAKTPSGNGIPQLNIPENKPPSLTGIPPLIPQNQSSTIPQLNAPESTQPAISEIPPLNQQDQNLPSPLSSLPQLEDPNKKKSSGGFPQLAPSPLAGGNDMSPLLHAEPPFMPLMGAPIPMDDTAQMPPTVAVENTGNVGSYENDPLFNTDNQEGIQQNFDNLPKLDAPQLGGILPLDNVGGMPQLEAPNFGNLPKLEGIPPLDNSNFGGIPQIAPLDNTNLDGMPNFANLPQLEGAPPLDNSNLGGIPPLDNSNLGGIPPLDNSNLGGIPPLDNSNLGGIPPLDNSNLGEIPSLDNSNLGGIPQIAPIDNQNLGEMPQLNIPQVDVPQIGGLPDIQPLDSSNLSNLPEITPLDNSNLGGMPPITPIDGVNMNGISPLDNTNVGGIPAIDNSNLDGIPPLDNSNLGEMPAMDSFNIGGIPPLESANIGGMLQIDNSNMGIQPLDNSILSEMPAIAPLNGSNIQGIPPLDNSNLGGIPPLDNSNLGGMPPLDINQGMPVLPSNDNAGNIPQLDQLNINGPQIDSMPLPIDNSSLNVDAPVELPPIDSTPNPGSSSMPPLQPINGDLPPLDINAPNAEGTKIDMPQINLPPIGGSTSGSGIPQLNIPSLSSTTSGTGIPQIQIPPIGSSPSGAGLPQIQIPPIGGPAAGGGIPQITIPPVGSSTSGSGTPQLNLPPVGGTGPGGLPQIQIPPIGSAPAGGGLPPMGELPPLGGGGGLAPLGAAAPAGGGLFAMDPNAFSQTAKKGKKKVKKSKKPDVSEMPSFPF